MISPVIQEETLYELQTRNEERFNLLTHGLGFLLSLVGFGYLLKVAGPQGMMSLTACVIYGVSLIQLFGISTFYHACPSVGLKKKARVLDHCAIYVLIAGSYVPYMAVMGGWKAWTVLTAVWLIAVFGIRYKCTNRSPFGGFSVLLYLTMGWLIVLVWHPLNACLAPGAVWWLVAGGVVYSLGVPFYAWRTLPYSHGIWHLFVLAGAACHFVSVFAFVY